MMTAVKMSQTTATRLRNQFTGTVLSGHVGPKSLNRPGWDFHECEHFCDEDWIHIRRRRWRERPQV